MEYLHSKVLKVLNLIKRNKPQFLLIFTGLFIFIFGTFNYYKARILSFNNSPVEVALKTGSAPTQIIIPSLKLDLPIEEGEIKDGVWQISYKNATHLKTSANPNTNGNIVIYGHNKKVIFGNLPYLSIGQTINIKIATGEIFKYKLVEKIWADPTRIDLVSPTKEEQLTLYTCWGLFDSQRVVLIAKPVIQ